jgi:hypothetical protein
VLVCVSTCLRRRWEGLLRRVKIVGILGVLLGCVFLASANAAPPLLDTIPVLTSNADEWAPSSQGRWFTWTQASHAHPNQPDVFAHHEPGVTFRVNARGTNAEGSAVDGHTLVYYDWKTNYTGDIRKLDLQTHRRSNFPAEVSTKWDEYAPSISGRWLLFTRYMIPTRTTKVMLYKIGGHELRTLGSQRGRHSFVYSGQVNGDYATWGRVRPGGGDVYLYRISTKINTTIPRVAFLQYDPAVARDGTVYYGESGDGCGVAVSLVRYTLGGVATVLHDFPAGTDFAYTSVAERTDGSLEVYFSPVNCLSSRWDIYKAIDSYTLSVSLAGSAAVFGRVTSDLADKINCVDTCHSTVHGGRTVTLTATGGPNAIFSGWSDASCGTNPVCAIDIESDVSLTATFDAPP